MIARTRFAEAGGVARSDGERALLERVFEQSPYLTELLIARPSLLATVAGDPYAAREKPAAVLRAEMAEAVTAAPSVAEGMRRYRDREIVRLGARECDAAAFEEVGRELAHLADACFEAALGGDGTLCVIAMGKMGGEELNFSSDVDVLYLYASDDGGVHERAARLAERVTRLVGERTEHGACFRVDLRLRPEGQSGPIANALPALIDYYESWGRPWERQAWLKARPAAGDIATGCAAIDALAPFVHPRIAGPGAVDDVRGLLARAQAEERAALRRIDDDLKLGPGGIRELEFFVQALQLVHAGKRPSLRERGTLRALDALLYAGLVGDREHRTLADAYGFLRRVENRIQLEHGAQTQTLPEDPARRAVLASRLGFPTEAAFAEALDAHRRAVRASWATLGVSPAPPAIVDFAAVPFADRTAAGALVAQIARRPGSPLSPTADAATAALGPVLVEDLADSPDPDQALRHLADLSASPAAASGVWRLLAARRETARLLVSLLGTSELLGRRFAQRPDLVDELLAAGRARPRRALDEIAADLAARLDDAAGAPDSWLGAMRRFQQEEALRVGLHDVAGALTPDEVSDQLSSVAEACVRAAQARTARPGDPPPAIVAMGSLGAREIDHGSDLDLVFVHAGRTPDDHERAARAAQRVIRALTAYLDEGRLFAIDTRLRPSGRQGVLVTTLAGLREYHAREARPWERQAWIRARAVAGDAALCEEIEAARVDVVWGAPPPADLLDEVARLRRRMEEELARETPSRRDLKLGRGGLADVEFAAQALQLLHGGSDPSLRSRRTVDALDALAAAGRLDAGTHRTLRDGHAFLRRLDGRLRIVHDRADALILEPAALERLARRLRMRGPDAGAALLAEYERVAGQVRGAFERIVG